MKKIEKNNKKISQEGVELLYIYGSMHAYSTVTVAGEEISCRLLHRAYIHIHIHIHAHIIGFSTH